MKRYLYIAALLLAAAFQASAQNSIRVESPGVVAVNEQFNVTFIIEGDKNPTDFSWSQGDDFQLVWGPQKGSSTSIQVINGKRTSSHQTTYTYILMPKATGTFQIPSATATVDGNRISSTSTSVQVVTDASSAPQGNQGTQGAQQSQGQGSSRQQAVSGEIPSSDLFLRLSLSRSEVVLGEPITASLKLYQRVNIAGFENVKFPTFNGFWSQETYAPTNIEFKRESFDDKIYNTAILRSYVLIPQQSGTITIDPAELVCLVNLRVSPTTSNSIFDSFFQDEYRTIRKRVSTSPVKVRVNPLPSGQPASFGGGVGSFGISARLSSDELKTHDAGSLVITVSGRGNVSLLEEPKVTFPPDFEVYDTKATENTDKANGRTSGSKSFEFPFIPRSAGDFTIEPIEYSYYDVTSGKYVTLHTQPLRIKVAKGRGSDASAPVAVTQGVERRDVKSLADDLRFISTKKPSFSKSGSFFLGSALFYVLLFLIIAGAVAIWLATRKLAAMRADVAMTKNRRATKMARKRLQQAGDFLGKNLYTAFYEELHKALVGFISDKLNMDMSEINRDNIAAALSEGGVTAEDTKAFTDLLEACEFARYSPDAGHEAMNTHYEEAVKVITAIDSSLRTVRTGSKGAATVVAVLLGLGTAFNAGAQSDSMFIAPVDSSAGTSVEQAVQPSATPDVLWQSGIDAYSDSRYQDAVNAWEGILAGGVESPELYCNIGDAYFKQGNYPKAILSYERALKLDPSYSDARYNLGFASGFVQDKIEPVPEFILKSLARKVCYVLGSNSWAVLFLVLLVCALGMGLMFLLSYTTWKRRTGFYSGIVLLVLSLCCLGFSSWQKNDYNKADSAIVLSPVSSVKSSPSGGKDLFIIHEGTKVRILDSVGSWKNISLADGRQGWIEDSVIEVI